MLVPHNKYLCLGFEKEFLVHIGMGAMAMIGVSGLVKNLLAYSGKPHRQVSDGLVSSNYIKRMK